MKTHQNPRLHGVFYNIVKKGLPAFALIWLFLSCEHADQIGLDLIDSPAHMFATDTFTIQAFTVHDDSVATNLGWLNVLGFINDPVFGKTRASIFTETRPPAEILTLEDNPKLDSIHLVLAYDGGFYGIPKTYHTVRVYELTENFPEEDTIYSTSFIPYDSLNLITKNKDGFRTTFLPRDSVFVDGVRRPPQLRIPLCHTFGQRILDSLETETFDNVANYLNAFKGLYITVDDVLDGIGSGTHPDPKGGMVQINMPNPLTSIELYYHSGDDTLFLAIPATKPIQQFPIDQIANHFTRVEHFGYEEANHALRAQLEGDISYADSLLFLQALGLVRADIHFPFIDEVKGKRWLINKARLVVPVEEGYESSFFREPRQLMLLRHTEENGLEFLDDYMLGIDYFGGVHDAENNQYVFNISQYFQKLIDGDYPNDGLALVTARRQEVAGRVVLHGPGRTENPLRLEVFYSIFE